MTAATEPRTASLRVLVLLETLCGYAAKGATNAELAKAMGCSPHHITRDIAVLIAKGWARKDEASGRFFPTPAFSRIAFRVLADFDHLLHRIEDQRRNFIGA